MIEMQTDSESMNFTPREWQYFVQEICDMIAEGKLDVIRAVNNARYLAILDKSFNLTAREFPRLYRRRDESRFSVDIIPVR